VRHRRACARETRAGVGHPRAQARRAAAREEALPPHPLQGGVEILRSKGVEFNYGDDFGAPDETVISEAFDRPVIVTHYPSELKAFYFKHDPASEGCAQTWTYWRPRLRRDHRRRATRGRSGHAGARHRASQAAARSLRLVSGPAPLRQLSARRLRSGHRAPVAWLCGLEHVRETIPFPRMLNRLRP